MLFVILRPVFAGDGGQVEVTLRLATFMHAKEQIQQHCPRQDTVVTQVGVVCPSTVRDGFYIPESKNV